MAPLSTLGGMTELVTWLKMSCVERDFDSPDLEYILSPSGKVHSSDLYAKSNPKILSQP